MFVPIVCLNHLASRLLFLLSSCLRENRIKCACGADFLCSWSHYWTAPKQFLRDNSLLSCNRLFIICCAFQYCLLVPPEQHWFLLPYHFSSSKLDVSCFPPCVSVILHLCVSSVVFFDQVLRVFNKWHFLSCSFCDEIFFFLLGNQTLIYRLVVCFGLANEVLNQMGCMCA